MATKLFAYALEWKTSTGERGVRLFKTRQKREVVIRDLQSKGITVMDSTSMVEALEEEVEA